MNESNANPPGRQKFALILTAALLAAAGVASYFGVRAWWTADRSAESGASSPAEPVEVEIPPGPHRAEFQAACVTCHSPRLALNQPPLAREKWAETVHKMVSAYGAPLTPADEARVVEYLAAVKSDR